MDENWLKRIAAENFSTTTRRDYADWLAVGGRRNEARLIELSLKMEELRAAPADVHRDFLAPSNACDYELYNLSREVDALWLVRIDPYLAIPKTLTDVGLQSAETIRSFIAAREWQYDGDGRGFVTPAQEEELAGDLAVLVVRHGGNEILDACFSTSRDYPHFYEQMFEALQQIGVWAERLDSGVSSIYCKD